MFNVLKKSLVTTSVAAALVLTLAACNSDDTATDPVDDTTALTGVDTLLTTIVSKSSVSGALRKEGDYLVFDGENFLFDYDGDVTTVDIDQSTGVVKALSKPIGTVEGTAGFPQEFANLAFAAWGWKMSGFDDAMMPAFPATIPFSLKACTLVIDGTTYQSTKVLDDGSPETANMSNMLMEARAFTGLGPVEFGGLQDGTGEDEAFSLTVRTGGCGALVGIDGPNKGRMGTICLNGSFTFDLSGLVLSEDPNVAMQSNLPGTGNSNCTVILQGEAAE